MKVEIQATEDPEILRDNLEKRFGNAERTGESLEIDIEDPESLERVPGICCFITNGERNEGLGGRPVQEEAYARLESRRDAVLALVATVRGFDLRILDTDREWDLRQLRRYNPSIKHLKFPEPREELRIEKSVQEEDGTERIDIEIEEKEIEPLYREMLT